MERAWENFDLDGKKQEPGESLLVDSNGCHKALPI